MRLTPHFSLEEFVTSQTAARQGIDNTPSEAEVVWLKLVAERMEEVRTLLGNVIVVTSGYRSAPLNTAIGGAATSQHCKGQAIDFICPSFGTPEEVWEHLKKNPDGFGEVGQVILEFNRWVHLSIDPTSPRNMFFRIGC